MRSRILLAVALLTVGSASAITPADTALAAGKGKGVAQPTQVTTAAATPKATLSVAPDHGQPGAKLQASVTLADCTASRVTITGSYADTDDNNRATPPADATAGQKSGSYTATLTIPQDAARSDLDRPITYTAKATCAGAPTRSVHAAAEVFVDATAPAMVTLSPSSASRGKSVDYRVTGCTGGPADVFFEDSAGRDFDVPDASASFNHDGTMFSGRYTIPVKASLGAGDFVVECAQADESSARLTVRAAAVPSSTPTARPVPKTTPTGGAIQPATPATPVTRTPTFTG